VKISLLDDRTLSLEFVPVEQTLSYVKTLPGAEFDRHSKTWTVSLCCLRRLLLRFPDATFVDFVAMVDARHAMWRRWVQQMNGLGVWFALDVDGETVVPVGHGVSPLVVEYVAKRSTLLVEFLGDQRMTERLAAQLPVTVPTKADAQLWSSIQGGYRAANKKAAIVKRARRVYDARG
jgi:hypothetical protein